jgi:DNA mismatch repair protein MutL
LEFVDENPVVQQVLPHQIDLSFEDVMTIGNGYAVATSQGRLMIVDLRRAKERVLYDSYLSSMGRGDCASQKLLFAEIMMLSQLLLTSLAKYLQKMKSISFSLFPKTKQNFLLLSLITLRKSNKCPLCKEGIFI